MRGLVELTESGPGTLTSQCAKQSNNSPEWEDMRSEHGKDKQESKRELTH